MAWPTSPDGGDFVHGIGYAAAGGESFGQNLTGLVIGQSYTFNFSQSLSNSIYTDPVSSGQWQVTVGGTTFNSAPMTTPALGTAAGWQNQSFTFVATATTQFIDFKPVAVTGARTDMGIDGITVISGPAGGALTDTANLAIVINGTNDAPVAVDDGGTTSEDGPAATGNVLSGPGTDADIDSDPLTVTLADQAGDHRLDRCRWLADRDVGSDSRRE